MWPVGDGSTAISLKTTPTREWGGMIFAPFLFFSVSGASQPLPGHELGRWCRIASGDIDDDGDPDLLLGALNYQTYTRAYERDASFLRSVQIPRARLARWEQLGNHLHVLKNRAKRSR